MIGCLLIHGYTGGPYEIDPLAKYLRKNTGWHINVPTLPGHGSNLNLIPENTSYKNWIKAMEHSLVRMLTRYDLVYLIGFSMGGMIASYLAAKYDDVAKLVLLAPSGKYLSWKQLAMDAVGMIVDSTRGTLHENPLYNRYKRKWGVVPFKAYWEFTRLIRFTKPYLKDVTTPVLIAQGHRDGLVPYKTAYYLEKQLKSRRKEVVFFEQSRHLLCLGTDKEALNTLVYRFLTDS